MRRWFASPARLAASWLPTVLTLAVLGALAFWGWRNDWRLWGSPEGPGKNRDTGAEPVQVSVDREGTSPVDPFLKRIEFPSEELANRVGIKWEPVKIHPMTQYVTANAVLDFEPSHYTRLGSRVTGTIWRVYREIGDSVHRGDVLALIESAEVGKAKADFLQSQVMVQLRTTIYERTRAAGRSGAASERALLDAEAALREVRIKALADQQVLLNFGLPLRLADVEKLSEEQLLAHLRFLGLPELIRSQIDAETHTANLLPLTAPFDGQVVQRNVAPGEVVLPTQTKSLFVIGNPQHMHMDLSVNPRDMPLIKLKQTVTFHTENHPTPATGKVAHISPEVDPKTRHVFVHADVEDAQNLRPNTFGVGKILIRQVSDARVVPAEAVQTDGPKSFVFIRLTPTSFQPREVKLGIQQTVPVHEQQQDLVQVTGVEVGEEVVTTGSFQLKAELFKDRIASAEQ
jgi:cobalt-zinc-cadmium efflux system membrane fusion protein